MPVGAHLRAKIFLGRSAIGSKHHYIVALISQVLNQTLEPIFHARDVRKWAGFHKDGHISSFRVWHGLLLRRHYLCSLRRKISHTRTRRCAANIPSAQKCRGLRHCAVVQPRLLWFTLSALTISARKDDARLLTVDVIHLSVTALCIIAP